MTINKDDVKYVKNLLWPDEKVELTVRQRRVGPGGSAITPTSVIATDKRLMIVTKTSMGIRKDFDIIPYTEIASVRFEHGVISSAVYVKVRASEEKIDGLTNSEAAELSDYLDRKISHEDTALQAANPDSGLYVYCSNCGTRMPADAKYCSKCGNKL